MATTTVSTTDTAPASDRPDLPTGPLWTLRDALNEARRHLKAIPRSPELLLFATIQPIMFVLLFRYVYDGSINVPGFRYEQYLMPGIFAQTVLFGTAFTGVGVAEDLSKGFIDRLRSLPISQPAVLIGRTISDLLRNLLTMVTMVVVSFLVGFRWEGGIVKGLLGTLLLLAFSYGFSWIQALIGLSVSSVEAANSAGFIWMFPLTFVSSAFVPPENMPSALRVFAEHNPFTVATNAARALYNGLPVGSLVWQALAWALGLTVVFSFLSIRKFERASAK